MIEKKAPEPYTDLLHLPSVFLAGSIEMGAAENWQERVVEALAPLSVLILNPRRGQWDPSWEQRADNAAFNAQVTWEMDGMDAAGTIAMYFAPGTKSPITLLELGLHAAQDPGKLIVCCPEGFWRKGNVDIVCKRHNITQVPSLEALVAALREKLERAAPAR